MSASKPTVLVTGIAGSLGLQLLPQVAEFDVVGTDLRQPAAGCAIRFTPVDLEREASCRQLVALLRDTRASAVIHLAAAGTPQRSNLLNLRRMWQVNVAGTARVMEAITEVNRSSWTVRKFIFTSSTLAYGPGVERPATEETRLRAETWPCAVHKREADEVAQFRAESLGECSTYILRPQLYAGGGAENYLLAALRGVPTGQDKRAQRWRRQRRRLSLLLPRGDEHLLRRMQFVHVADVARLIAWILHRVEAKPELTILNVAGRGEPIELQHAVDMAQQKVAAMPRPLCTAALRMYWRRGIGGMPPEALPYLTGPCLADTTRLRRFLGADYEKVIQHTVEASLRESFQTTAASENDQPAAEAVAKQMALKE